MMIEVTVSGGWAGRRTRTTLDTRELAPVQGRRLTELVSLFLGGRSTTPEGRARDARTYAVSVDGASRAISEATRDPETRELLSLLREISPVLR